MNHRDLTDGEKALLAPLRSCVGVRDRRYPLGDVEIRYEEGDADADFRGHATVYGKGYDMYGGPSEGGWTEYVDEGAGKKTLSEKPDVAFLANHTGLTLARTTSGRLTLAEDSVGLDTRAKMNTARGDVRDVVLGLRDRDLTEMSFAFKVMKQRWLDADGEEVPWWDLAGIERHITEYSLHKGDVSVVNYGANPHTDASMRALLEAQEQIRAAAVDDLAPVQIDPSTVPMHPDLLRAYTTASTLAR